MSLDSEMTTEVKSILDLVKDELGKPYKDLEFLLDCLKDVLIENGEEELLPYIPWLNTPENIPELNAKHVQLYSIIFQLLNTAEVNGAVQNRRKIEDERSLSTVTGLWAERLEKLKEEGVSEEVQ